MRFPTPPMRILSVRLDDESDAALRSLCARTGLTQTEVVKAGIGLLARESAASPAALGLRFGLVGAFDSGDGALGREHSARVREKLTRARRATRRTA